MKKIDRSFFIIVVILVVSGFLIFTSASLGLLARGGAKFSQVAFNQILFGIVGGSIALLITSRIPYRFWKKNAFYIFILSIIATLFVFIPGVGLEFGGARRWLDLGITSFQPAELLKIGFIMYLAAYFSSLRTKIKKPIHGLFPFIGTLGVVSLILLSQPDTGTLVVMFAAGIAMFFVAGAKWSHIFSIAGAAAVGVGILAYIRPYVRERIFSFLNPASDPLGASYQIQQSLISIGSGEWFGRGFGQSIQKFNFLPEPIGDSIFSVAAEEFGFIGSIIIISIFLAFAFRGYKIATKAPDYFSGLLVVGIVTLIVSQSFINIGAMLGILPLTGLPLPFISHGGTALFFALAEVGIVLNISKYMKKDS